jgi:UDP-glucose 4-epimerase
MRHGEAARGTAPDLSRLVVPARADDALDLCYVKDTGRAIALLQLAQHLNHSTYNVGSGRATTNADVAAAIKAVEPNAQVELPAGGAGRQSYLDITRLRRDTGFEPEYDTARAAADYIDWSRAGHDR